MRFAPLWCDAWAQFFMKDGYNFDVDKEAAELAYKKV